MTGCILADRYMWHATLTAGAAFVMWTIFLVLLTFGRGPQAPIGLFLQSRGFG